MCGLLGEIEEVWFRLFLILTEMSANRRLAFRGRHINLFERISSSRRECTSNSRATSSTESPSMYIARQMPRAVGQCCRAMPRPSPIYNDSTIASPARHYTHEASVWQSRRKTWKISPRELDQRLYPRARRRFTTSPLAMHGHLDPPKPGEE